MMHEQRAFGLDSAGRRWSGRIFGICGTILLHAFYLQAVNLGAAAPRSKKPLYETGPGASPIVSSTGEFMTVVIVRLPGIAPSDALEVIASRGIAPSNVAIQIASPDPNPAFDVQDEAQDNSNTAAIVTAGDPAVQSMLFGRYTGQINARVERAWQRPRSAISGDDVASLRSRGVSDGAAVERSDRFRCVTRIVQDDRGNVKEVELLTCNGTWAWRRSLINAIQSASPLPAPPSPKVFTSVLTLTFEGRAYVPGEAESGYEPALAHRASDGSGAGLPSSEGAVTRSIAQAP